LLIQLGERLRRERLTQGLTAVALAQRAGISRMTLSSVEAGEPAPTMGTYLRVMSALGLASDLALLANGSQQAGAVTAPFPEAKVTPSGAKHGIQDLQSLMLHEEAVKLLRTQPKLIARALETLETWRASSGNVHSRVLLDEWSVILRRRDWRRALTRTRRSMELRQASPLPTLLPRKVRDRVLQEVNELRTGKAPVKAASESRPRKNRAKSAT